MITKFFPPISSSFFFGLAATMLSPSLLLGEEVKNDVSPSVNAASVKLINQTDSAETIEDPVEMVSLNSPDIAISINGKILTWGQLNAAVQVENYEDDPSVWREKIRIFLQKIVKREALIREANKQEILVSEEEEQKLIKKMAKDFKLAGRKQSVESYLNQFPESSDSLLKISRHNMFRVAKLVEKITNAVVPTKQDIESARQSLELSRLSALQLNNKSRQDMLALLEKPELNTEEGFAALAKQYSKGKEAASGGILGVVPRSFVARAHGLEEFSLKQGKTSGLLETETAFRVIRVLDVQKTEDRPDDMIKVAQIILPKVPVPDNVSDEQLEESVERRKKSEYLEEEIKKLIQQIQISCPLFPHGLF